MTWIVSWFSTISTRTYPGYIFRSTFTFLPFLISTTSCVGTRAWRIGFSASARVSSAMRRAIRFRTLFSCPAVVWMAYQRRSGISEQSRHELHEDLLEQRIHETNHDAENGDEDDDHRRRLLELVPSRPRHFAQLVAHVAQELQEAADGAGGSPSRLGGCSGPRAGHDIRCHLLRFLVRLLLVAARAELLPLRPLRMLAPVLRREVVPAFAHRAFHDDVLARHLTPHMRHVAFGMWHLPSMPHAACRMSNYFKIFVTTPAPTVRPPSRIAKRSCSSIAIGVISSIVIFVLSPGITISTPAGSSTLPVTSVVRK